MSVVWAALVIPGIAQDRFDPAAVAGGGVWIRRTWDPWCVLDAQPLLSFVTAPRAGIVHSPGAFGLGELSSGAVCFVFPVPAGRAGIALTRFGFDLYSEYAGTLGWGGGSGPLRVGAALRLTRISIRGYGSAGILGIDLGAIVIPLPWFRWGVRLTDVNRPRIGNSGDRLEPSLSLAGEFLLTDLVDCSVQAAQGSRGTVAAAVCVSARCSPWLLLRCALSENFNRMHAGLEVMAAPVGFGYACIVDPLLGWSHTISLSFPLSG